MAADRALHEGSRWLGARSRALWIAAGAGIVALGIGLPSDLAPPVPLAPIDGTTLARLGLALSGLIAVAVGVSGWRLPRLAPDDRLRLPPTEGGELRRPLVWLAAITIVAAALRVYDIGQSLWIDEIITVAHANRPFHELFTGSPSLSNHLLHTLLVRAATSVAGQDEWSIRLPAVAFGVATVPVVYALARVALRPREALLAALILATSYTHISFSQNSRGYAAFVFWTAVATWLLLRALAGDRGRDWWGFAVASFLACATIVLGGFTLVGQAAALLLVAAGVRRAGGRPWPIVLKGLVVIGAVGLALFDLYALALPGLYRHVRPVEMKQMVELPNPFWDNLGRGLGQAFGNAGVVALLILAVLLAAGMIRFVRRHPITCAYLAVPVATLGAGVLLMHLFAAPRYFLWAVVPFSIGLVGSAAMWPRGARWPAPVVAGLVVTGSLVGLKDYYHVPFQASRESVEWILKESAPEDIVVPVAAAQPLARYYGRPLGLFRARTVHMASTIEDLQSVDRVYAGRRVWLITTARRPLVQFHRDMVDYIDRCYQPVRSFPAKIHGMQITVWRGGCGSGAAEDAGRGDRPIGSIAGARPLP
jgi:hypothetical protein